MSDIDAYELELLKAFESGEGHGRGCALPNLDHQCFAQIRQWQIGGALAKEL
ncbi:MAG: hypothetical protein LW705_09735 [Comamonadaceae bacterium]|nr:hypothetical protein [Comamonadaceae bacterium]